MVALDCLPLEGSSLTSIMPNKIPEPLSGTFPLLLTPTESRFENGILLHCNRHDITDTKYLYVLLVNHKYALVEMSSVQSFDREVHFQGITA